MFSFTADINECANKEDNECSDDADCTDTDGSYQCACKEGFSGNGIDCKGKSFNFV